MSRFTLTLVTVCLAAAGISGAPRAPRPGVDWPQFRGIAAGRHRRRASRCRPTWNAATAPTSSGRPRFPASGSRARSSGATRSSSRTSISGKADANLKVGLYGDIASVQDDTPHEWRVYALDKKTGKRSSGSRRRYKRRAEDQAPHEDEPRQLDAGDRRRADHRVLRIRRALRLRPEGQAALEEGSRRARRRLLHGARGPVGDRQLAGPPRRHGDRPGGRAEGIVPGDVRREGRPRGLARRRAPTCRRGARRPSTRVNGQTQILVNGMRHVGAYDFKTGKEIWKLSGGGDIPVPTPGRQRRPGLHHQRARPAVAGLRDQGDGDGGRQPEGRGDQQRRRRLERAARRRLHVHAARLSRPRLHRPLQRRPERVRREDRREEISRSGWPARRRRSPSSPVANDGKVYIASEDGQVFVLAAGPEYEVIAMNEMSTPGARHAGDLGGRLLLRTQDQMMAIGRK